MRGRGVGLALVAWLGVTGLVEAQDEAGLPVSIGARFSLWSEVLQEERPYWVYLPESYDDGRYAVTDYPVLYLLDGDVHFHAATGIVQFMSAGGSANIQIPELIVVGIPNTNRTRDLTPSRATGRPNGGQDVTLRSSGGGDAFLGFLGQELVPAIDRAYRTKPYRLVVGHSFGGLLALHALVSAPELFQGYVAIDPSLFWDDELVVRRMQRAGVDAGARPRAVHLSLSGHPPGGRMDGPVRDFAAALQAHEPGRLRSTLERFDEESHQSVPLQSLYRGLGFIFDAYRVTSRQLFDRPGDLGSHFAEVSSQLGVELKPPERILDLVGHSFLDAGLVGKAIELFGVNVTSHPTSSNAHASLGEALAVRGDLGDALEHYEMALELNPDHGPSRRAAEILRRQN